MAAQRAELPLVAIVGPTGSGKSELALTLAERFDGEAINADSMQFYRGMDIGTAKLPLAQRRGIAHHLMDFLSVREDTTVAAFQSMAREAIAEIRSRGKLPILVGGSGLYNRAALDVLEFPGTDPDIRAMLEHELERDGLAVLVARLQEVDPVSAARINDAKRVVRALEVHALTGRAFSSFMPEREYVSPTLQIGLNGDRAELHARLARRVHGMVDAGLIDEVRALIPEGLREGRTAHKALGYQQFLRVLDGSSTVAQASEETIVATRQFARRQLTWFRADPRVNWLDWSQPDLGEAAAALLKADFPEV
ncbi:MULTISPECIES: tRNA (adenosine(37)-N6)-dimethylallyltransferase MiaA [Arthrobacter]|uniref:tRNA dimethylallyltransferase n=1 Tax=Arthrobacter psychrochitiniphilus TaxID=291045 RepID=A0A2V3DUK4_9MICC|nr:tRNA (adenosine(37)-N6)-dimethylallyltransferase MiaA [Arthrobacter psychrochitiniphilus]NYG16864.1 tRNA dimethylallyltransferase [Arthrobacter psychrochitiniphilus]PXA69056.1 tRNA (adenosine(37)-N6)-dimethylallyltransferase MiaA [Arthrobacter psychrochitiniphilus]